MTMEAQGSVLATGSHGERCWRCGEALARAMACGACQAPQPLAPGTDHYAVLGVRRGLVVERDVLDAAYLDASRAVHPDRHATADARVRALSLEASAAVNRAHRTLRDAQSRGRYWLELHGEALGANNNQVPPALAEIVFETQEQLEAFRADAAQRAIVERAHGELEAEVRRRLEALERQYAEWDATDPASPVVLRELKARLSELAYRETLVGDVDETLDG